MLEADRQIRGSWALRRDLTIPGKQLTGELFMPRSARWVNAPCAGASTSGSPEPSRGFFQTLAAAVGSASVWMAAAPSADAAEDSSAQAYR